MEEIEKKLKDALSELKKDKERKFNQTVDLIVNLKKFDVRKDSFNLFINLPHKIKDKKVCAFLVSKSDLVDSVTEQEFNKYSDKKELKKLAKKYDFFMSQASLMQKVATSFGRVLGPTGKMPSPQLGIMHEVNENSIKELKEKINHTIKTKIKEASIKISIGKQDMEDKDLLENVMAVYNHLLHKLPRGKDNIKNIEIKFTMSKPKKIYLK